MHSYRSHDSTSCHVTARDISRFHSVIFCTGHRYNVKSKLSIWKVKIQVLLIFNPLSI